MVITEQKMLSKEKNCCRSKNQLIQQKYAVSGKMPGKICSVSPKYGE